jgi:citrate synthase
LPTGVTDPPRMKVCSPFRGWVGILFSLSYEEMIEDPDQKIGRPRQLYTGAARRDYSPISRRK